MATNQSEGEHWGGDVPIEESASGTSKGRLVFLFVVGFLLGVSIKAQAIKSVTMGYDDYKLKSLISDFRKPEAPVVSQSEQQMEAGQEEGTAEADIEASQSPQSAQ